MAAMTGSYEHASPYDPAGRPPQAGDDINSIRKSDIISILNRNL
jgi:hypothetical protein